MSGKKILITVVLTRIKDVLNDREKLADCVNKAIEHLEAQKTRVGADALAINEELDTIHGYRLIMHLVGGALDEVPALH